jgi:hypothetical protein
VEPEREPEVRRVLLGVAIVAAIWLLSLMGLRPPSPKPASIAANQFSAGRALAVLNTLMGDDVPHPVGSAANAGVRERVMAEFKRLGYQPSVQTSFACNQYGICATVNNVLVRLDGSDADAGGNVELSQGGPAVLLAAHYDSVPAGPGISDDGVGVAAALEIARALKSMPSPRHSIIFLIDDGEEGGLLGARAFVDSHPWAKDVRAAVNMDARGTSGPSLLFETGSANDWAIRLYARNAAHPATSSIFYTAYKQLPNDTDFTIFKAAGYQGLNFAFIGDVVRYHTPLDNIANVDAGTMQHQGDNAMASLLALANTDISSVPEKEAVYFDVFQQGTVRIGAKWMLVLAIFGALLVAFEIAWLFRGKQLERRGYLWGLASCFTTVATAGLLALIVERLMRLAGALQVNWVAHPVPVETTFWSLAIAVVITLAILFARRAGFWGLWGGVWTWWALLSLATAWRASGVSYVLVISAGIASLAALPLVLRRKERTNGSRSDNIAGIATILPLATAGILGFGPALLLYDGLGNRALPFIAAVAALLFTAGVPLCFDLQNVPGLRGVAFFWTPIIVAFAAAFTTVIIPGYSATAPERMNIAYWKDADTGKSQWIVESASGQLPEAIRVAATFQRDEKGPFPWDAGPAFLAAAPGLNAAAPTLTVLRSTREGSRQNYRVLLRSERGASEAMAVFPPGANAAEVRMNGQPVDNSSGRLRRALGGWAVYRCPTMPAEGVEMAFALPIGEPLEVYALDVSYGLPGAGRFLLQARPLTATASQDGDVTIVSRHVELNP